MIKIKKINHGYDYVQAFIISLKIPRNYTTVTSKNIPQLQLHTTVSYDTKDIVHTTQS